MKRYRTQPQKAAATGLLGRHARWQTESVTFIHRILLGVHDTRASAVRCAWPHTLGHIRRHRERWTGLLAASKGERDPSLHPSTIGGIFNAEFSLQPRLVL